MSVTTEAELSQATPAGALVARKRARVKGRVVLVEVNPADAPARLTIRISDGSGFVDAVFLGRRIIPGIQPGVTVIIEGLVATDNGAHVIFNPAYELVAA